jgi:uncharacterized protein YutE (UPF0331/DUF86 family)
VVDERRVRLLLQRIQDDLVFLHARAALDRHAILGDEDKLAAVKYYLLITIEGCLAVAQHLCASEGWGPPADNSDAMRLLAKHGVLDADLASALATAIRFRNLLVHEYATIDDQRVVSYLDRLADLEGFVAAVSARMRHG